MKSLFFISFLIVLVSCTKKSTKVSTNDIYQHYRIEFREHENRTKVRCRLRKKRDLGANIEFVDGDQVLIQGVLTQYGGVGSYTYEREFINFLDTASVELRHRGQSITNFGLFSDVYTASILTSQLIIPSGFTWNFEWDGPPIQGDFDRILIEILNSDDEVVFSRYNDKNDYNVIDIPSSEFGSLTGTYKLRVTRSREMSLRTTTASGGKIEMVYVDEDFLTIY